MATIYLADGRPVLLDDADLPLVQRYSWHGAGGRRAYAGTHASGHKTLLMHRLLLQPPPGRQIDHVNHDTLDNRRANLRLATPSQNNQNRRGPQPGCQTGVRNVYPVTGQPTFQVKLQLDGRQIYLGLYGTLAAAADVARQARAELMSYATEEPNGKNPRAQERAAASRPCGWADQVDERPGRGPRRPGPSAPRL